MTPNRALLPYLVSLLLHLPSSALFATNANVVGPEVKAERWQFEGRAGWDEGADGRGTFRQRVHLDYGLSEAWGVRVVWKQLKREGGELATTSTDFELKYQLFEDGEDGFDGAAKLVYSLADGDSGADQLSLFWLQEFVFDGIAFRSNLAVGHETGEASRSGVKAQARWQVMVPLHERHRFGIEMFNNFGNLRHLSGFDDQFHRAGPVLKGRFADNLTYQTGLLFGLSEAAPDLGIKGFLIYSF